MSQALYVLFVFALSASLGLWAQKHDEISNRQAFVMSLALGFFAIGLWMLIGD